MVRVRFAPSPTGYLHFGTARTALFNWLFARHNSGKFILRIEDTDMARSSEAMSQGIITGLKWLGLDWDEGPYFQSQRLEVYLGRAEDLVRRGRAYYCYCLPEEIQKRKRQAEKSKSSGQDSRCCFNLSGQERKHLELQGRPQAIRFLIPEGEVRYRDLIHGLISVRNENIEDFVLLKSDGCPTYHLSVVVDDIDLGITHVIRGDDHISNTPKQILLYQAFETSVPEFAHLALILGPDKKKLSKRHGVTSVLQFKGQGYLPLALLNFLAQMSWNPGEEERIYSVDEMIKRFTLDKMYRASPVFDLAKLEWLNGQLISQMAAEDLLPYVREDLRENGLWSEDLEKERREWFLKLLDLLKQRNRVIKDFTARARPFLSDTFPFEPEAIEKYLKEERIEDLLPKLEEDLERLEDFSAPQIERALRERADKEGIRAGLFIHALRVLILGMKVSPGIFEVLELMGKEKTVERLKRFKEIEKGAGDGSAAWKE